MWFPKFGLAKQQYPALAEQLDRLKNYLTRQAERGESFFIPKLAAAALSLNDGEAYVLLEILARNGTLQRAFNVYCRRSGRLLATVHSEADLKDIPHCDECDTNHEADEVILEVAFEPAFGEHSRKAA